MAAVVDATTEPLEGELTPDPPPEVPFHPIQQPSSFSTPNAKRAPPRGADNNSENDAPLFSPNATCSICLDALSSGEEVYRSDCGHTFHFNCMQKWRSRSKKSCPICRGPLKRGLTPKGHVSPPPTEVPTTGAQTVDVSDDDLGNAIRAAAQRNRATHRRRINMHERMRQQLANQAQRALEQQQQQQLQVLEETEEHLLSPTTYDGSLEF